MIPLTFVKIRIHRNLVEDKTRKCTKNPGECYKMTDNIPTVNVIIPTYNRAHLIGRSIRSVLDQTYQDFEIIVVDDGSKDNTEEVVKAINDPRIIYLKQYKNLGAAATRNTGIKAAKGKFIAFQDSDDEWLPRKLEKQMECFEKDSTGDLGLVVCDRISIIKNQERYQLRRKRNLNYVQLLSHFTGLGVATQCFLLKRDLVAPELYFDERLRAWEEWDLMFRVSRICRIHVISEPLVKRYLHGGDHVDVLGNRINAKKVLIRKYAEELTENPKGLSYAHWQIALDYYKIGDIKRVRLHMKKAVAAYPRNLDYLYQYTAAALGRRVFKLAFNVRHAISVLFFRGGIRTGHGK